MDFVVNVHSVWRWAVLFAGVIAIVAALGGAMGMLDPRLAARRGASVYLIAIDIQLLLGLIAWAGKGWYAIPGFHRLEHPLIMLIAIVLAHVGARAARRVEPPQRAALMVLVFSAVSLLFVIIGIPGVVRGG
jgi:hypothetical protein